MKRNQPGVALKEDVERKEEALASGLRETLGKVDRVLERFFQIHGSLIKDQGQNP